jgi:phage FluMu gp28-like protein
MRGSPTIEAMADDMDMKISEAGRRARLAILEAIESAAGKLKQREGGYDEKYVAEPLLQLAQAYRALDPQDQSR